MENLAKELRDVAASIMAQLPTIYGFGVSALLTAMNLKPKSRAEAKNMIANLLNNQANTVAKLATLQAA